MTLNLGTVMRWELLDRFLNSECSDAELAEVLQWAAASPRHVEALESLSRAFEASGSPEVARIVWERLQASLMSESPSDDQPPGI